jgi:excinuclease UvrABC nuclease subunit
MYRDKYFRDWAGPFPFTRVAVNTAPAMPGVYQILYQGKVVYIGISATSIHSRLTKHLIGHGNWGAARRTRAADYEFVYFLCDSVSARQIESNVITNSKPQFNVQPEYKHYIDNITVH